MQRARSMRLHAGFPLQFWEDVVDIVVYLINRPSSSLDGGIPEEAWIGKKVNYYFLKTFDCEAFVHIDKENKTKLEEKYKKCTFIGYSFNDFCYHLWDYENHKIIRSRVLSFFSYTIIKSQYTTFVYFTYQDIVVILSVVGHYNCLINSKQPSET